jgi:hypothetical protein
MGGGDFTAASHAVLIVALLIGVRRMLALTHDAPAGRVSMAAASKLPSASAMTLLALMLERSYYFLARVLAPEFNLWALHPAPEILSLFVAFYVVNESHAVLKRRGLSTVVRRARTIDAGLLASAWLFGFAASWVI